MLAPLDKPIVCPITVGREPHLAALDRLLDQLVAGQGQTLLTAGEAGIGKSRLVAETKLRAAERGIESLQGHCFETDRTLPYAPFIELLRSAPARFESGRDELIRLLPELAERPEDPSQPSTPLSPEQHKRRLFQALTSLVSQLAHEQPLLIVIEDIHWADETSLELMRALARTAAQRRLLLALTYRSDEVNNALRGLLTALDRSRLAVELRLERLSRDELDAMLRAIFQVERLSRSDFVDLLYGLTDGNPFFVEEVLRALVGAGDILDHAGTWQLDKPIGELRVPRSVEDAVQRRTAQLSQSARDVVALAAVAGRRFDFELLGALTGLDEPSLVASVKELIAAGLVVEEVKQADQLAFRHALTRQAIYARLLGRERRALHRQVADALEQLATGRVDEVSADLAYHYAEANQWAPALAHARRAGERALRMYAPRAAVEQLTRAVTAAQALGSPRDAELLRLRGQAYDLQGDFERARADLEASGEAARAGGAREAEWQALLDLSLLWARRSYDRTGAYAGQALDLARSIGDARRVAQTLNRVGNWHMNRDEVAEAIRHHEEALRLFEQLGDERGRAETLDLLGMASSVSASRAAGYFGQAIPLLRRLDDRPRLVTSLVMRMLGNGSYLYEATPAGVVSSDEAVAAGEEALRIAREMGWPAGEAFVLWETALWLGPRGVYGRALRLAGSALALATEIDHRQWMVGARCTLGLLYRDIYALAEAEAMVATGRALARDIGSTNFVNIATATRAFLFVLQRRWADAASLLDEAVPLDLPMASAGQRACWLSRALFHLARDEPRPALEIAERLIQTTEPGIAPPVWHVRGEALAHLGRATEAVEVLEAAAAAAQQQTARGQLWRIQASLARVLRSLGRRDEAEQVLSGARCTVQELAAEIDDPALRDRFLRQASVTVPAAPPPTPARAAKQRFGGLTAREREVARLIAQGLSNRAIADRLVLGERTIESYVGNILSKLGFGSRAQIAAWVVESGLADVSD